MMLTLYHMAKVFQMKSTARADGFQDELNGHVQGQGEPHYIQWMSVRVNSLARNGPR